MSTTASSASSGSSAAGGALTAPEQIDGHRLTGHQKSLIGMAIVGNVSEFFDMFLIGFIVNLLIEAPGWNLTGFHSGVILAGAGLGTVLGSITWGRLADVFGRKHAFIWCIVVLVVFTAASALTPVNGWIQLAVLRTGVGFGVGGLNITSVPFVQEFVPAKQRGLLSGLTSVFIPAGIFLGGLVTKYFGDALGWRGLIAVGCVPILLLAFVAIVMWLVLNRTRFGRHGNVQATAGNPFKKPVLMAQSGAVFSGERHGRPWIGQGIGGISTTLPATVHQGYAPAIALNLELERLKKADAFS